MPNVFVVQDNGHDVSKAVVFGEIQCLFGRDTKINVFAADALARDIREKLGSSEEDDFLLLTGNAVANCIAYAHLMKKFARVNLLIWSFRNGEYERRTICDVK